MKKSLLIFIVILGLGVFLIKYMGLGFAKEKDQIDVRGILNNVKYLSSDAEFQPLQYRVTGMDGERKAAKYIGEAFEKNGLEVEKQNFSFDEIVKENSNKVKFSYGSGAVINPTTSKVISSENVDETIHGTLINFGTGTKKDYESKKDQIKGKFLLLKIDESTSPDCFTSLELSKYVKGIIVYDPSFVPPTEPVIANKFVMSSSNKIGEKVMTVTTVSKKDYDNLATEIKSKQEISISEYIKYDVKKERRNSQNVVAVKSCKDKNADKPLIIVGAHYDCVNDPGADDNASGTAALIELTKVLSSKTLNYDVKYVAFGAEEVGILGSNYFVSRLTKEELKRCRLMINIDGPGIGDVFVIGKSTGEPGEFKARELACETARKNHIIYKKLEFPDSDQFYFSQAGIPTITFASLEYTKNIGSLKLKAVDSEYHTFYDLERENIIIPKGNHSLNDTYDLIEKSNKKNSNFKKLFKVLLEVIDNYNINGNSSIG